MSKSILAAFLISLGVAVNLTLGPPLGPIFFSFGLLGVCVFEAQLFTGKAGYWWRSQKIDLFSVLVANMVWGWFFGWFIGIANPSLIPVAIEKTTMINPAIYLIQSFFCGSIMYICVDLFKKNYVYGIFLGVPLFIYCGFQHSIANAIMYGVAHILPQVPLLMLCAMGNFAGAVFINLLSEE